MYLLHKEWNPKNPEHKLENLEHTPAKPGHRQEKKEKRPAAKF
jgi:hypothetical protein